MAIRSIDITTKMTTGENMNKSIKVMVFLKQKRSALKAQDVFVLRSELPGGFGPEGGQCKFSAPLFAWGGTGEV